MNAFCHGKGVIGVVLAGGRSSRMGKDKALLQIEAQTMIKRMSSLLQQTSVGKVVVSRNDGNNEHIADLIPDKGPLSGIHSIATRFPDYNLLILPVDLPLMDANTLERLIFCGCSNLLNVRFRDDNLPLFIHNTVKFRQVIDYTLKSTMTFSVEKLCSHFPMLELTPITQSKMFNTNTPEQWRFAMQYFDPNNEITTWEAMHESFK